MPQDPANAREVLLAGLNEEQRAAVGDESRRLLVVAGAGSGKTEVMARRVAWWVAVDGVPKDQIIAFTFTEAAAEELKFRIRAWLEKIATEEKEASLGGMFIGTIHGFCLQALRDFAPDEYYMFDVVDDAGRIAVVEQGYHGVLALSAFRTVAERTGAANGKFISQELFLRGYDLLNEYGLLNVSLSDADPPVDVSGERDWCVEAELETDVGDSELAAAFGCSAARYYAYLRARRFLDFSTIQSEAAHWLRTSDDFRRRFRDSWKRLVVDEVQDINPVQYKLIREIVGEEGHLTAVGDHRQAIYSFRGGRADLMGELFVEFTEADDGRIQELPANYRSTPRIIDLSNRWSETIEDTAGMTNPAMEHRRNTRVDLSGYHVAQLHFDDRAAEAEWIADSITKLVCPGDQTTVGAFHDERKSQRGLAFKDIAILVRSGTDIRTYQNALRERSIHPVVRGGPDLFSQPEVQLFLAALAICSGMDEFYGAANNPRSLPGRIRNVLGVDPIPEEIVPAAISELRRRGLRVPDGCVDRLLLLCRAIQHRLESADPQPEDITGLDCDAECRGWLTRNRELRRIFPQTLFHWLLREAGIGQWRTEENALVAESTLFHVGQLSSLVKAMETSGWTPANSLKWRLIALTSWGASAARTSENPLLVSPDAVSITTVHSAKGLEFAAVFLADVCARRFPSSRARTPPRVPFDPGAEDYVDPKYLADNDNFDDERRLMYVALTRAERYLFVSASGNQRSRFFRELTDLIHECRGGYIGRAIGDRRYTGTSPQFGQSRRPPGDQFLGFEVFPGVSSGLTTCETSWAFTPTIGQEFGYGRGLHNLLRIIHTNPRHWAELAGDARRLRNEVKSLVDQGMFYLRYTVGRPLENLRNRAIAGVVEYVQAHSSELARLQFEPEKEFETLIEDENLLIAGAIDVVRLDDPPRVSIIDFKSGNAEEDTGTGLSRELMAMQIGVYGLAARDELEYDPQHGLIRYIGERDEQRRQLDVDLTDAQLAQVREEIIRTGRNIRQRNFNFGPTGRVQNRCHGCDFLNICPRHEAAEARGRGG